MLLFRHVGDLANLEANKRGKVFMTLTDNVVSLQGTNSVLDRAVVVSILHPRSVSSHLLVVKSLWFRMPQTVCA